MESSERLLSRKHARSQLFGTLRRTAVGSRLGSLLRATELPVPVAMGLVASVLEVFLPTIAAGRHHFRSLE